jgi:hypothetical protein
MLDRLYVDNYRCMVNFDCRFSPAQLILGPNGAGKTTLLDVVCLLRDFCIAGIPSENSFVDSTRTRWQNVAEQTFELDASGNGGQYTLRLVVDRWGSPARARVLKEEVLFSGKPIFRFLQGEVHLFNDRHEEMVQYPFDWHRSALATTTERPENTKLSWFKRWLGGVLYLSPDPHQMSGLADRESRYPTRDLSNFAAWYRHLRLESDDQTLFDDLREVIPGFESMALKDAGMGYRVLLLNFFADGAQGQARSSFSQFFNEVSDGQRVLAGLYTALRFALKPETTLLFDEPDNFIALKEIEPWLDAVLQKVEDADNNTQVLIVSHHPELLNRLGFKSGVVLDRPGGRHTRTQAFSDPLQTGLSPAELVARGWDHE